MLNGNCENNVRLHHSPILGVSRVLDSLLIVGLLVALHYSYHAEFTVLHAWLALVAILAFSFVSDTAGLYHPWHGLPMAILARQLMVIWLIAGTVTLLTTLPFPSAFPRNQNILFAWLLLTPLALIAAHWVRRTALAALRNRRPLRKRVAIVGATRLGERLGQAFEAQPWRGCHVLGFYDDREDFPPEQRRLPDNRVRVSGDLDQLVADCYAGKLDLVFLTLPMEAEDRTHKLVRRLADSTVSVYLVPDIFHFDLLYSRLTGMQGIPAISIYDSPLAEQGWSKRLLDLGLGVPAMALLAFPMLAIAIAIKLDSPGPVFFRQTRYGVHGEPIKIWKFRSMSVCEDGPTIQQAQQEDERVTRVGAFLRRSSLDELPQILNVLGGSMSLVGPRPHAIAHNEYYRQHIEGYMLRHKVKPGITGYAQINGYRGETENLEHMAGRIKYDLDYIRNWSLWLDLKIILLTPTHGLVSEYAY
ncbi:undecaprenyl-phosphate glucose phosphotransferase [Halorhodospira neutriphila]|uniref:Undecaprenyl-phosphate glucose phosphotransferase n=2 Tax=Halorhodospira neutriphila TaxID=168379 RepID=A0ABS1E2J4_9GAMM|nr:undecaprenyl-phosphate glucose phosphotransferase [Halorhodospira neutriphila]MBK1725928.1 undecaprenyl-phosphate glucose phosphotransferase [Halorhodospira neutriphila]